MQVLGYPATWKTTCFINGGCGASVFAHTNGYGDFSLFDALGYPWQIHDCYLNRFLVRSAGSGGGLEVRTDRREEYRAVKVNQVPVGRPTAAREIEKVDPQSMLAVGEFPVVGVVQDYLERQADRISKAAGGLGLQSLEKALGKKRSQITIVTSELKSYTAFADLSDVLIARRSSILATVRAIPVLGMPGRDCVFVASHIVLIRGEG